MMMVMNHPLKGKIRPEKRCPYCFSRRLSVEDVDVATDNELRFGRFKFILRCKQCRGVCVDLNNLETEQELRSKELEE